MNIMPSEYDTNYGLRVVICRNAETICSGSEVPDEWQDEATQIAEAAADRAVNEILGFYPESDSFFQNWNGGKYYRRRLGWGWCHISAWSREYNPDEGFSEWEWLVDSDAPDHLKELAERVANAASEAMSDSLAESEKQYTSLAE